MQVAARETRRRNEINAMTARTTEGTVTFAHQFNLSHLDAPKPAGTYRVVMVDEEVPGLTFMAYRRAYTMLHVPALAADTGRTQVFTVDKDELEAALNADQRARGSDDAASHEEL
jgi:hypothetical protein